MNYPNHTTIFAIAVVAKNDNIWFNYIGIPSDYRYGSRKAFNPVEMKALFDVGYQKARKSDFWFEEPFDY